MRHNTKQHNDIMQQCNAHYTMQLCNNQAKQQHNATTKPRTKGCNDVNNFDTDKNDLTMQQGGRQSNETKATHNNTMHDMEKWREEGVHICYCLLDVRVFNTKLGGVVALLLQKQDDC